ncbi:MAG: CCA tRNA nucleotidyltransferase [Rhodospirillales bacterium]|nr:CCA tRNA nucleotidyltransferase [Alphaproteobacteria bacterium]MCB9987637.1 CCA tRNA nucleotidyltransferase [Rhodospirillales bacterium]USO08064.1 MAG: CCA tRNA nucleotidyltransferase [Rhodospirillales bacterium]
MTPRLTLSAVPGWLGDPGLRALIDALGGSACALLVGGAVRSAVLGEAPGDIDVACVHTPDIATQRLNDAGIKVVPTGIAHGTVTAVVAHRGYEITTLRRDVETDGRRAVVAFTTDWAEDAQRRDFTMNTLLMDMDGRVFDPTGQGVDDLKNGVVRFVGDAGTRIREDALRILRFFRFHARYGRGEPAVEGYQACVHSRDLIKNLSRERVTQEVEKLVIAPRSAEAIKAMIAGQILGEVWQENYTSKGHDRVRELAVSAQISMPETLIFAYDVYRKNPEILKSLAAEFFVLSNRKSKFLFDCIEYSMHLSDKYIQNLYLYGRDVVFGGMILSHAINELDSDFVAFQVSLEAVRSMPVPVLPFAARDLISGLGLSEGPQIGVLMKQVEAWWLAQNALPDRDACLAQARSMLQA